METKEYVVGLNKGVDFDTFWAEMENPTNGLSFVPDRSVNIVNERLGSLLLCHYSLTDEEAERLRKDPRVYCVEIPPGQRKDIKIVRNLTQQGNFIKTNTPEGNKQNWGLVRSNSNVNNFGTGTNSGTNYDFVLEGTNVDVVIMDSGLMAEHLEFTSYKDQSSRVKIIDWYVEAGMANIGPVNLKTAPYVSASSNSYINFERIINAFWDYSVVTLGGSLVLGGIVFEGTQQDPAKSVIWGGAEDGDKSYRIRFEGWVDKTNLATIDLIWECRFLDDNIIEILVVRHDKPLEADWRINLSENAEPINSTRSIELSIFEDERLIGGAVQRSCVLASSDAGLTWNVYGDDNVDYHVELAGSTWNIVEGVATERGSAGLTELDGGVASDNTVHRFNTPFDFYCGLAPTNKRSIGDDTDGHGTHVAGIVAGKTFGWAKNANIYALKIEGLEGPFDPGTGLPIGDAFDLVKEWHNLKPVNPLTGVKNPTVVNMSFGYVQSYFNITDGVYRGTPWTGTAIDPAYGMTPYNEFINVHPVRVGSVDIDVQEMITAGIHVVIAAGNTGHKVDVFGGLDYDNYYNSSLGGPIYYHRGSSPYDDEAIIVGATGTSVYDANTDQREPYSEHGPGVDIYAPGGDIISAISWINAYGEGIVADYFPSPENNLYKQALFSGTSMAAPQVAGAVALLLEQYPEATPAEIKNYILTNSTNTIYEGSGTDPYTDPISLQGGTPRHLYNKFNVSKSFRLRFGGE